LCAGAQTTDRLQCKLSASRLDKTTLVIQDQASDLLLNAVCSCQKTAIGLPGEGEKENGNKEIPQYGSYSNGNGSILSTVLSTILNLSSF
jgi:hypothetical protein